MLERSRMTDRPSDLAPSLADNLDVLRSLSKTLDRPHSIRIDGNEWTVYPESEPRVVFWGRGPGWLLATCYTPIDNQSILKTDYHVVPISANWGDDHD